MLDGKTGERKMNNRHIFTRIVVLSCIVIAVGYAMYSTFIDQTEIVNVGDLAPNFVLKDLEGNEVELEQLKGKGILLNFWATFCPPCREEMPYMENSYEKYKGEGIEILAVNFDEDPIVIEKFVDHYELSYPILLDSGLSITHLYGVRELPATFLIDEDGFVIERRLGALTEQMIEDYVKRIRPNID